MRLLGSLTGPYIRIAHSCCSLSQGAHANDLAPLAALQGFLDVRVAHLDSDWSDSEPVGGTRHQVGHDALVGLALVNLPELLDALEFDAATILQYVLKVQHVGIGAGALGAGVSSFVRHS